MILLAAIILITLFGVSSVFWLTDATYWVRRKLDDRRRARIRRKARADLRAALNR